MITDSSTYRKKLDAKYSDLLEITTELNRKMVSFQANKNIPFYNWFGYKEGFSYQMVKKFLESYHKKSGDVLDPFAGSCTTLFASNELGFNSTGIELLPIGEFVLKSKMTACKVDCNKLAEIIQSLKKLDFLKLPINDKSKLKHIRITKQAFSEETEYKLNSFREYIRTNIQSRNLKQVLNFGCFCILEKISFTRKDGQYLRWDYRAKKSKTNFNKGKIYSFEEALFPVLDRIVTDLSNSELLFGDFHLTDANIDLKRGSCNEILPLLEDESFDLIITSPPYCNRYDYTRTYALELVFLGVGEEEIKNLRQSMLSCTVENKDKKKWLRSIYESHGQLDLHSRVEKVFEQNKALQEVLGILKEYKIQKRLNNPGIYRMVKNYFYEHAFVVFQMSRLLKPGGRIYYVNDNVRYAGETIPVDLILSEFAKKAGLEVKKIFTLQNGKGNSSQQMGQYGRDALRKCVYFWRKPN
jgi:DNA modification methylase